MIDPTRIRNVEEWHLYEAQAWARAYRAGLPLSAMSVDMAEVVIALEQILDVSPIVRRDGHPA